jgi:hypothetical protein
MKIRCTINPDALAPGFTLADITDKPGQIIPIKRGMMSQACILAYEIAISERD